MEGAVAGNEGEEEVADEGEEEADEAEGTDADADGSVEEMGDAAPRSDKDGDAAAAAATGSQPSAPPSCGCAPQNRSKTSTTAMSCCTPRPAPPPNFCSGEPRPLPLLPLLLGFLVAAVVSAGTDGAGPGWNGQQSSSRVPCGASFALECKMAGGVDDVCRRCPTNSLTSIPNQHDIRREKMGKCTTEPNVTALGGSRYSRRTAKLQLDMSVDNGAAFHIERQNRGM